MAIQPFDPIGEDTDGEAVEPPKGYMLTSKLEGPPITGAWRLTGLLLELTVEYFAIEYASEHAGYEQLEEAIAHNQTARGRLEGQLQALEAALTHAINAYNKRGGADERETEEILEKEQAAASAVSACEAAIADNKGEEAKLLRERASWLLSQALEALLKNASLLLLVARLRLNEDIVWLRSLETHRILSKRQGRGVTPFYSFVEAILGEIAGEIFPIDIDLLPGDRLLFELEVIGPQKPPILGEREGPELGPIALSAPTIAIAYTPAAAPAVN